MMKKKVIRVLITGIFVLLCIWRLWPHSLNDILPIEEMVFNTVSVNVSEFGVSNNLLTTDTYLLEIPSPEDKNYAPIMSILLSTQFRPDFRNLLPYDIVSVDPSNNNVTQSATIMLTWGNENDEVCHVTFHDERIVSLYISGKTEFLVYHPTNRAALEQIATYTIKNGEKQT